MERARRASYDCPHCRQALEAGPGPWQGWLLCPRCGLPGMPPQAAPGSGGGPRRPGPRPAPARGVFVTNAPKEKLPGRPAYVGAAIALLAIVGSLSTLIYLDQLKLETVALTALMVLLFGLLAVVRGHRR